MYIGVYVQNRYSGPTVTKLAFSGQFFEKYSNIKFHEIHIVGAELFHVEGRTDGHDEANSRFSQFCESAQKLKKKIAAYQPTTEGRVLIEKLVVSQLVKKFQVFFFRTRRFSATFT